ncbi:MAG TPA: hypothetical protein VNY33_02225, partial [Gaiellaceae bacterium]|nr:hypothetical protein [Gaiellaceae bacterium]
MPAAGVAATSGGGHGGGNHQDGNGNHDGMSQVAGNSGGGYVTPGLLAQALANPTQSFKVIVQGKHGYRSADVNSDVQGSNGQSRRSFRSIAAVAATLSGKDIVRLAKRSHV